MRRKAKVDQNQQEIVKGLRKAGFSVAITSMVANGFPDLVIAKANKTALVELKFGKGKLRDTQLNFINTWRGIIIVGQDVKDIIEAFHDHAM